MSFRAAFLTSTSTLGMLGMLVATGCDDSQGGFGKAQIQNPGINVKESKEKLDEPPNFETAMTMRPSYQDGEVVVTVALKPGFHAYAPGEEIGRPVNLVVKEQNGWQAAGAVQIPEGKTKDLGELGISKVLEGTFPLRAKVSGGEGAVAGELEIQICTEDACDRPRKHAFQAPAS